MLNQIITDLSRKNKYYRAKNEAFIMLLREAAKAEEENEAAKGIVAFDGFKPKSQKIKERADRIMSCGTFIELKNMKKTLKISSGNFCHDKYCSLCQRIRRTKRYAQMLNVLNVLRERGEIYPEDNPNRLIVGMVTLTQKNVPVAELGAEIDTLSKAIKRLTQTVTWTRAIHGYAKSMEITYNKTTRTFHPHFHFLVIWNKDQLLHSAKIQELWKRSLRADYFPQCDIREAYGLNANLKSIISECLKYNIKEAKKGDEPLYKDLSLSEFQKFIEAIRGRRFVSYGGIIANVRKELNYPENEENDQKIDIEISNNILLPPDVERIVLHWSESEQLYKQRNFEEEDLEYIKTVNELTPALTEAVIQNVNSQLQEFKDELEEFKNGQPVDYNNVATYENEHPELRTYKK